MGHSVTTLDLLRHGKPEGGEVFRGSYDVPLSQEGWQQMQESCTADQGWQRIISSPLKRCADFARELARQQQLDCQLEPDLREICFGDWEGRSIADVRAQDDALLQRFWREPENATPPNGEPLAVFSQRVTAALWQRIRAHQGEHLLMVCHGGVIRVIVAEMLAMPTPSLMRFDLPYAAFSRIRIYHDDSGDWPQLVFFNRHGD